ncbi:MAG: hypothetical protein VYC39_04875 [Myxococcota bacterium]|nr:hypothetical protein [Myxococcota bacterium]
MHQANHAFKVVYRSLRKLNEDHQSHITHGGILVPKPREIPAVNTICLLRLELPSGAYFDFPSRVVHQLPGQGFIAAFEPGASNSQHALDELILTEDFKAALRNEASIELIDTEVEKFDPEESSRNSADELGDDTLDDDTDQRVTAALSEEMTAAQANANESAKIANPVPGETLIVYVVNFATLLDFIPHTEDYSTNSIITLNVPNETAKPGTASEVRINLPGKNTFQIFGRIKSVEAHKVTINVNSDDPNFIGAIHFPRTMRGQKRLASEQEAHRAPIKITRMQTEIASNDEEKMPLRRRLQRMTMDDKINLALSGDREARMALATDGNKAIHHYLLKNAKISMDEIVMMARLATLNPDVLKKIAENPAYTQNPQVVKNLVFNPKTPAKNAVRLIDRLPRNVLNMIAKRPSMNRALVAAAQKKLGRK